MARYLLVLLVFTTFFACSDKYASKVYQDTNTSYRKQAKRYAQILGQYPLHDSATDNGPLFYYPKSHSLPYIMNSDFAHGGNALQIGRNANKRYEERVSQVVAENKLEAVSFLAKKGDVFIWHANLMHGGKPILNPNLTRKSMVVHYYAEDVIKFHEIMQRPSLMQ